MDRDPPSTSSFKNYKQNCCSQNQETRKIFGEIEEIEDEVERRYNFFRNFDIVPFPPYDHHYLITCRVSDPKKIDSESSFRQRIKQEWELCYADIPSSIFLRAYEHRIDLMRAAVVGPPGSDFHHCLFFFDIFIPREYPSVPPEFYYHSYRVDLNPNLRLDGRVCLTLPETWYDCLKKNLHGSNNEDEWESLPKAEKWNPEESNIVHALHAIQNMILNLKPRYPDPSRYCSYAKSGSLNSYNDKAFVLGCEMMIRVLREPPMGFEDFVAGHFRRRAHPVLLKFKENKYDSEVMVNLFVKLFKVFERNGAYCKHHLDFLKSRKISIEEVEERLTNLEGHHQWDEEDPLKI